ncbi:hypothetical protein L596_016329 [Steinernema carpocapsae]|uniref:Uncharacterized protein n=1 Tax=Steinernema carpocapsae TaxID=34508 RepID=A0A4U5NHS9_STECR|nr:hypothetical protein L596_016329 [Steinernema carpocapsae]
MLGSISVRSRLKVGGSGRACAKLISQAVFANGRSNLFFEDDALVVSITVGEQRATSVTTGTAAAEGPETADGALVTLAEGTVGMSWIACAKSEREQVEEEDEGEEEFYGLEVLHGYLLVTTWADWL